MLERLDDIELNRVAEARMQDGKPLVRVALDDL
jgi:hypothetical protein